MTERPESKTALVTGAGGGIGGAVCTALRRAGYVVIGSDARDVTPDCDRFLRLELRDLCGSPEQRAAALSQVLEAIGHGDLTLLVNNAAVQRLGSTTELTEDDWRETIDVNVLAPFFLTQGLLAALEQTGGSVVNVSSIHASLTKPGFVAYATSKAALAGLTRSMAVDLGGRIRVNAVVPAATATPMLLAGLSDAAHLGALGAMHPIGRIARPEEVAAAVLYLASDAASFMTGAILHVDGGIGARLHDPV